MICKTTLFSVCVFTVLTAFSGAAVADPLPLDACHGVTALDRDGTKDGPNDCAKRVAFWTTSETERIRKENVILACTDADAGSTPIGHGSGPHENDACANALKSEAHDHLGGAHPFSDRVLGEIWAG